MQDFIVFLMCIIPDRETIVAEIHGHFSTLISRYKKLVVHVVMRHLI